MKNILILIFSMLSIPAFAQRWNPLVSSIYILPSPLDLAHSDNATLYVSFGNGGFYPMDNLASPLRAVISLSGFVPDNTQDVSQSITGADYFDVIYLENINTLIFEQNAVIPGALDGISINNIQISVKVSTISSKEKPRNGFQINLVPPGYTNSYNNTEDDAAEIFTYTINAILPVELTEFYAASEDCQVNIYWATASELNNDVFILDKSLDTKTWNEVAHVKGHGTTSVPHEYKVVDAEEKSSLVYYRLIQKDFDGTTETSHIISVNTSACQDIQYSLFPNPASDFVQVVWNGVEVLDETAKIEIYTSSGQWVKTVPVKNIVEFISVEDLIPGAYQFVAQTGSTQSSNTVIIQR